jgi:chromosome segregation ATPase
MTETPHSEDIATRIQELDNVLSESTGILNSIRNLKGDAEKIIGSLSQKKDELSHHQEDIADYLQKLMFVSQKAEALLSPILEEKQKLEVLDKKITEALAGIDAAIQEKLDILSQDLIGKQMVFETGFSESLAALHKEIETGIADAVNDQHALADTLSKRIDSAQHQVDAQKVTIEGLSAGLSGAVKKMGADNAELRKAIDAELRKGIQDVKTTLEKHRHDIDAALADSRQKQKEELTAALTELYEKQKKELQASLEELRNKSIKPLEKENARIKSVLNAAVEKLNNVKFKKFLGL